jgi:undecaprenyl phosphate-alpha-L-ara4N flippase subunit ArnF
MTFGSPRILGLALLAASIVLSAVGQLGMKVGMQELRTSFAAAGDSLPFFGQAFFWTAGGLFAYALSMVAWLAVLVRYPLSFAYPLLSLSYVLVYIGATQWDRLLEAATPLRTSGTLLILVGVAIVSMSDDRGRRGKDARDTEGRHGSHS